MGNDLNEIGVTRLPHRFDPLPAPGRGSVCTKCSYPPAHSIHVDQDQPKYEPNTEIGAVYDSHQS